MKREIAEMLNDSKLGKMTVAELVSGMVGAGASSMDLKLKAEGGPLANGAGFLLVVGLHLEGARPVELHPRQAEQLARVLDACGADGGSFDALKVVDRLEAIVDVKGLARTLRGS